MANNSHWIKEDSYLKLESRLRADLIEVFMAPGNGWNFASLARCIGVNRLTITKFIKGGNIKYMTYWKISIFLKKYKDKNSLLLTV